MRHIQPQQNEILNDDLELKIGVFKDYFRTFNLLSKKRSLLKNIKNKTTLTEWQAIEVLQGDYFLISAVFKFGPMNKTLMLLYNLKTNELHDNSSTSFFHKPAVVAPSLEGKSHSFRITDETTLNIYNQLDQNKLFVDGLGIDLTFDLSFERIAKPSVVSVPMDDLHTVYTEKDLLQPKGYIQYKDKTYKLTEDSLAILDDHRGYYPLTSGYDWATCLGHIIIDSKPCKFGLNITYFYKNINHDLYNENGYWLEGNFHQLPTVYFKREGNTWYIKDDDNIVDLVFTKKNQFIEKRERILKVDYTLAFGSLTGTIKTKDTILTIDNMFALGEERKTQLLNRE